MNSECARLTQVVEQLNSLDGNVESLENIVNELGERLLPLLTESSIAKDEAQVDERLVPLANSIRVERKRVQVLYDRISDILKRLEL